jgi:hypothetical protein
MEAEQLLNEIASICRRLRMAESTFGRRAVNDGKLVTRLRQGGRVTLQTVERVRAFIDALEQSEGVGSVIRDPLPQLSPQENFRFFDNRQKYLMFVNTCSEKAMIGNRVAMELASLHPRPPAIRLFDAGIGDGSVLARVLRSMHRRFPWMPFLVVGKEISIENARLTLDKMADRFFEHPQTVLVLTNMSYFEAPGLSPRSAQAAASLIWHEVALTGGTAGDFEEEIMGLEGFLNDHWRARISPATGGPIHEKPAVLILYREDNRFLLDNVIPRRGAHAASYDLIVAGQPFRSRAPLSFKAGKVMAPLARSLGPGGRLIGIHSCGSDPGHEIVQRVWPGEEPFLMDRHQLLKAVRQELGAEARGLNFTPYSDERSQFRYEMHILPNEIEDGIRTSTLLGAWNAATYVAQIEDQRLTAAMANDLYLDVTRNVLAKHGGLWFRNESYVISRKRDIY